MANHVLYLWNSIWQNGQNSYAIDTPKARVKLRQQEKTNDCT
jgi:hypothetical protein